jgi:hypothetical protein
MLNSAGEARRQRLPPQRLRRRLRRLPLLPRRHRQPARHPRRRPRRNVLPSGEPTRRGCKPVASPKRPMLNNARLAAPCRVRPLPNPSPQSPRLRRPRVAPHQPRRKLRQRLRRKSRLPRQLRHQFRLRRNHHLPKTAQRWKRGNLRMKVPPKPIARPTRSCGSTYHRRSITSLEQRATGPQSVALICVRKRLSPEKIAHPKQRSIHDARLQLRGDLRKKA